MDDVDLLLVKVYRDLDVLVESIVIKLCGAMFAEGFECLLIR